jgi:hypothetical protein
MSRINRKKLTPSEDTSMRSTPIPPSGGASATNATPTTADIAPAPTPPLWHFNSQLSLISHEPNRCDICNQWTLHYVRDSLNNQQSLLDALRERDRELSHPLTLERDSLLSEVNRLQTQLAACQELAQPSHQVRDTPNTALSVLTAQPQVYQTTSPHVSAHAPPSLLTRMQPQDQAAPFASAPRPPLSLPAASPPPHFRAILPIVYMHGDHSLHPWDPIIPLTPEGHIIFSAHNRYVLATGSLTYEGPDFRTTLVKGERFITPAALAAREQQAEIPFPDLVLGGRNGVLISPTLDPQTQEEVERLFSSRERIRHAREYAERIRFTPQELRGPIHSAALAQWATSHNGALKRPEPLPSAPPTDWKYWLRQRRRTDEDFDYIGIPLVGTGYQSAHIEGNRALLNFIPLNNRGTSLRKDFPRKLFLTTAAALLGVPQRYERLMTEKQISPAAFRYYETYSEPKFGNLRTLNIEQIARFLASAGVLPSEAEQWRPWATAFIEMELDAHPGSTRAPTLRHARELARKSIEDNPALVLRSVHTDAPGNYNPALERAREARDSQSESLKRKRDTPAPSPQQIEARPLTPIIPSVSTPEGFVETCLSPTDEPDIAECDGGWDDDEDMRMGPDLGS